MYNTYCGSMRHHTFTFRFTSRKDVKLSKEPRKVLNNEGMTWHLMFSIICIIGTVNRSVRRKSPFSHLLFNGATVINASYHQIFIKLIKWQFLILSCDMASKLIHFEFTWKHPKTKKNKINLYDNFCIICNWLPNPLCIIRLPFRNGWMADVPSLIFREGQINVQTTAKCADVLYIYNASPLALF